MFHMDENWTQPDNLGTWTLGADAHLVLYMSEPVEHLSSPVSSLQM